MARSREGKRRMKVNYGDGSTKYGPGVLIELSGEEMATAIDLYLHAKNVLVRGPRTITYCGELCADDQCEVYVDPSGFVMNDGELFSGEGPGRDNTNPAKEVRNLKQLLRDVTSSCDNGCGCEVCEALKEPNHG